MRPNISYNIQPGRRSYFTAMQALAATTSKALQRSGRGGVSGRAAQVDVRRVCGTVWVRGLWVLLAAQSAEASNFKAVFESAASSAPPGRLNYRNSTRNLKFYVLLGGCASSQLIAKSLN